MLEVLWSGRYRVYWFLLPISWLYGLVSSLRRVAYQRGWLASWQAPIPVVVVGNLTVGGAGKTPLVVWLVKSLQARGIRVGVVSRGYGGRSDRYPLSLNMTTSAQQAGDEPVLIFQRTGVPVVVAPDRSAAVRALLEQYDLDIVITDDGLQHYALRRSLELVVVDGVRRFGNGWWLPAGPMRERVSRLASVDAVIVNGGKSKKGEIAMQLVPGQAVNLLTGEKRDVRTLTNIVAMAGIGYPTRFFDMLTQIGVNILSCCAFTDHQVYELAQLTVLTQPNETLLMTEKDAVKCRGFARSHWWYLPVNANLDKAESEELLAKIEKLCH